MPAPGALHLRAGGVSVVLALRDDLLPVVVHWGPDLGDLDQSALDALATAAVPATSHSGLDAPAPVELLPQPPHGYAGRGGPLLARSGRTCTPCFVTRGVHATASTTTTTAEITADDTAAGVTLTSEVCLDESGVLRIRHTVTNDAADPLEVQALPVRLPLPDQAEELLDLTGRWARERLPQRHRLPFGAWVREGRRGRTGHDAPLLLVAGTPGFGFRHGAVYAVHHAWSGDSSVWAERLPESGPSLGAHELLAPGEVVLAPGASYSSPWVYAMHAADGLDGLSDALHRWVRSRPGHPRTPRPVVLNTWEAVYFDHDLGRLTELADAAAEIGVERFVLDDGWFGGRRNDRAGLGDWTVSAEVWPDGLAPLIDHVRSLGMDFGLWVEPEMVNLDSDLVRAHPDWVLRHPDRMPPAWREQQVLDLAHPDAFAHILERLDALLGEYDIAYLKWDHNRDLVDVHHEGAAAAHVQTTAFYALLDALRERHPDVEIESCASGGGRVDLEVLARTDRIWTSDCTDALERQRIQRWTGLLVPPELVGAHVSAPRNHQTGRVLDLSFRAGTALFGHFGIEWDITTATPDERDELAAWVALYQRLRPLLHSGQVVRGDTDHLSGDGLLVHGVVAADRVDAVFALVQEAPLRGSVPPRVLLPGLDPDRTYRVRSLPPGDRPATMQIAGPPWLATGVEVTGAVLGRAGLAAPILGPAQLLLLEVTALPARP